LGAGGVGTTIGIDTGTGGVAGDIETTVVMGTGGVPPVTDTALQGMGGATFG
jgi:hypothetical protein